MIQVLCIENDWSTFMYRRVLYMARLGRQMRRYSLSDNCWYEVPSHAEVFNALTAWLDSMG